MTLQSIIETYGYVAIFVGAFLEGETILLMAGFAAHGGHLQLPWVMATAFAAGMLGDQLYFHLGHWHGERILSRIPGAASRSARVWALLRKYDLWLIVGIRFMYGIRIVGPVVIGMSGVPPMRFAWFNGLGALIWAVVVVGAGYLFGQAMELLLADFKRYEMGLIILLASGGFAGWAIHRLIARKRKAAGLAESDGPDSRSPPD